MAVKPLHRSPAFDSEDIEHLRAILASDNRPWKFDFIHDGERIAAECNGLAIADWHKIFSKGKWITEESLPFLPMVVSPKHIGPGMLERVNNSFQYLDKVGPQKYRASWAIKAQCTHEVESKKGERRKAIKQGNKEKACRENTVSVPQYLMDMLRREYPTPENKRTSPYSVFNAKSRPVRAGRWRYIQPNIYIPRFFGAKVAIYLREPSEYEQQTLSIWLEGKSRAVSRVQMIVPADTDALNSSDQAKVVIECQRLSIKILSHLKKIEAKSNA